MAEDGFDWNEGLDSGFGLIGNLGQSAFQWMGARDRAKYSAREAEAWAAAYASAAPSIAQAQVAGAVMTSQGRDKLLLAGFAVLAVVVLFRIRPTANG